MRCKIRKEERTGCERGKNGEKGNKRGKLKEKREREKS